MSQKKSSIFLFFLLVNILNLISKNEIIIPTPNEISFRKGTFQIDEKTMILSNEKVILFKELYGQKKENSPFYGLSISFTIQYISENKKRSLGSAVTVFQTVEQFPELNHQKYTICNSDNLSSEKSLKILIKNKNVFLSYDRDALHFSTEKILGFAVMNLNAENYLKSII